MNFGVVDWRVCEVWRVLEREGVRIFRHRGACRYAREEIGHREGTGACSGCRGVTLLRVRVATGAIDVRCVAIATLRRDVAMFEDLWLELGSVALGPAK